MTQQLVKKNILGVSLTDASCSEVLEYIFDFIKNTDEKMYIVTPNPEIVMHTRKHPGFKAVLNDAGIALCDGVGLIWAGRVLGSTVKERITGVDLMENLCKESVRKAVTVAFLGGRDGVAERVSDCLVEKYPRLKVAFVGEEWPGKREDGRRLNVDGRTLKVENRKLIHTQPSTLKNPSSTVYPPPSSIDILFVAFGFPKQEIWMAEHLEKLPIRVMVGVGGAFDYFAGEVSRAPKPLRDIGLEWLYRLIRQPWRLKRQLALPQFAFLVLKERFRQRGNR